MGAKDLMASLCEAGLTIVADGNQLVIRPASRLTDNLRSALVKAKPELLALLATPDSPYRLTPAQADAAHREPWSEVAIARFVARVGLFMRRGLNATDADDLAERLTLRDLQGDDRRHCLECNHFRVDRCSNHRHAGLLAPEVSREVFTRFHRCPGFACAAGFQRVR